MIAFWEKFFFVVWGPVAGLIVFGVLFGTLSAAFDAVPALLKGEAIASPFGLFSLVMLGWGSGHMTGHRRAVSIATTVGTTRWQLLATMVFIGLLLLIRRDSIRSWVALVDATPSMLVSVLVWGFVVLAPWNAARTGSGSKETPK